MRNKTFYKYIILLIYIFLLNPVLSVKFRIRDCSETNKSGINNVCNSERSVCGGSCLTLNEGFNIIYVNVYSNGFWMRDELGVNYQNLSNSIIELDSLNIAQCIKNNSGIYESKIVHGYISDKSNYYTISYYGDTPIESKPNNAAAHSNDCSGNVGGLIQVLGKGPIYLCFSENKGVEFFKENGNFLLDIHKENIFVDNTNNTGSSVAVRAYTKENYSGFFFNYFTDGDYCVDSASSTMSQDSLFCKSSILINYYHCNHGLCSKTKSSIEPGIYIVDNVIYDCSYDDIDDPNGLKLVTCLKDTGGIYNGNLIFRKYKNIYTTYMKYIGINEITESTNIEETKNEFYIYTCDKGDCSLKFNEGLSVIYLSENNGITYTKQDNLNKNLVNLKSTYIVQCDKVDDDLIIINDKKTLYNVLLKINNIHVSRIVTLNIF